MAETSQALSNLLIITDEASLISQAAAVLSWDQETFLPPAAISERAAQGAVLSALVHQRMTSDSLARCLSDLGASDAQPKGDPGLSDAEQRLVRQVWRTFSQAIKIPESFIREFSFATSEAQAAWAKARENNDFAAFKPQLERVVQLCVQKASYLGTGAEAYDALLDEYEPGVKSKDLVLTFDKLAADLTLLVKEIARQPKPDTAFLKGDWPIPGQQAFGSEVLAAMGFDFQRGRLDESAHPFTTTLGRNDVRITTKLYTDDFTRSLYSIIHESGHALYEQGIDLFLPSALASGSSLGIHESQSRIWENIIGRSQQFWTYFFPLLKTNFPDQLKGKTAADIYRAVNKVEVSGIRIYADEVTYTLHILLRFNLERALIRGELSVADLPEAWRSESERLLGWTPVSDAEGCLQDIHWAMGAIGYFPTYALGNLYSAMFMQKAEQEVPALWKDIEKGDLVTFRNWLHVNIHRHGLSKTPAELLADVCHQNLTHEPFLGYIHQKYRLLYGLTEK